MTTPAGSVAPIKHVFVLMLDAPRSVADILRLSEKNDRTGKKKMANSTNRNFSSKGAVGSALLSAACIAISVYAASTGKNAWTFTFDLLGMTLAFAAVGQWISQHYLGILIDNRNVFSLSRIQIGGWFLLIASAILTMAIINLVNKDPKAIDIDMPPELLALMGISTTSLVGSALILSNKKSAGMSDDALKTAITAVASQTKTDADQLCNQGMLIANKSMEQARLKDLLTGEELADAAHIDIVRVQMLFFTAALLAVYGAEIVQRVVTAMPQTHGFPSINQYMVGLIAISHGGYLMNKAIPATQT